MTDCSSLFRQSSGRLGRLLVDRLLLKNHINPAELESLDRLAVVGSSGMGALEYVPEYNLKGNKMTGNLDYIAGECKEASCNRVY